MDFAGELLYDPLLHEITEFQDSESECNASLSDAGGYNYEFIEPVLPSQECPVCKLPMRDAVQTRECGHRFCRGCLEQTLRTTVNGSLCPTCRSFVDEVEGYYVDRAWSRDILSLLVKCVHHKDGCDWAGELRHIEKHLEDCLFEEIECNDCGERHIRRKMIRHRLSECELRIVQCHFCKERFSFIHLQKHEDKDCKRYPLECANECEHGPIPREEMLYHLEMTCPKTRVKCLYAEVGCQFEGKRCSLSDHLKSSMEDHLKQTFSELFRTREEVKMIREDYHVLLKCFSDLKDKNNALEKEIIEMKQNRKEKRKQNRHCQRASVHGEDTER